LLGRKSEIDARDSEIERALKRGGNKEGSAQRGRKKVCNWKSANAAQRRNRTKEPSRGKSRGKALEKKPLREGGTTRTEVDSSGEGGACLRKE